MLGLQVKTLLEHAGAAAFVREFQERHLGELESALRVRWDAVQEGQEPWVEAEPWESRVQAHLEALQVGGPVAVECARGLLGSEDEDMDKARAALMCLASHPPETRGWEAVAEGWGEGEEEKEVVWRQALALAQGPWVVAQVDRLLRDPRAELRAAAAWVLGWRQEGEPRGLMALLEDESLQVRQVAALGLGRWGYRPALPVLERALSLSMQSVEEPLLEGLLRLGSERARLHCRETCKLSHEVPEHYLRLLGLVGAAEDWRLLRRWCGLPDTATAALEALGVLGVAASVPLLLECLEAREEEVSQAAASALELLGGKLPGLEEAQDRHTVSAAWQRWWGQRRWELEQGGRWRRGQPWSLSACVEELAAPHSPNEVRRRVAREVVLRNPQAQGLEVDWPVRRQRQVLERWRQR